MYRERAPFGVRDPSPHAPRPQPGTHLAMPHPMTPMPRVLALIAYTFAATCALAQVPTYSVQIVPDPPVPAGYELLQRDLNAVLPDGRVVVTNVYNGVGGEYFIGTEGDWQHFQPLPGDVSVIPHTFSSNGLVAGLSIGTDDMGHVVLWNGTVPTGLNPQLLHYSGANGINPNGVVSGTTYNQQTARYESWTWQNGQLTDLPTPAGYTGAMASQTTLSGLTVGYATSGNRPPVLWHNGVPSLLTVPDGDVQESFIGDINESGWIVGGRTYNGSWASGCYLWRDGQYELLRPSWNGFKAQLSDTGDVLFEDTWTSSLWRDGVVYNSHEIVMPGFDGSIVWMQNLLDDGRILAKVELDGTIHNAVLTPIPAPATLLLLAAAAMARARRQRA